MKKSNFATVKSITEELAQDIGVTTHQLQMMTTHQIKGKSSEIVDREYYNNPRIKEYRAHLSNPHPALCEKVKIEDK